MFSLVWSGGEVRAGYLGGQRWRVHRSGGSIDVESSSAAASVALEAVFAGVSPGREVALRAPLRLDAAGESSTFIADSRMVNGWTHRSAIARATVGRHELLGPFIARLLARNATRGWEPGVDRVEPQAFGEAYSFAAFSTADDRDALCTRLADLLTTRLRASSDPGGAFVVAMHELRVLGHDLWSLDDDVAWGADYMTPRAGAGLLVGRTFVEDEQPEGQIAHVEFRR